ncbi:MAG: AbrB/MazE/SpoVT family DNA-binding domain-containing protein [Oscillospiraceae bacterium]|nr:AbrB/MazE/SpoVT family DNA-binding domain-containing protein [Oscillospiraceae bacterium]
MKSPDKGKFMTTVKIGPKGQIVIPKEIREMFNLTPGDSLLFLADAEKGMALERLSVFNHIADVIFKGKGKELYPDKTQEDSLAFAKHIRDLSKEEV